MKEYEKITTADECRKLATKEFGPLMAEIIVRGTVPNRCAWRQRETLRAAGEGDEPRLHGYEVRRAARLRLDLAGVGGILDAEGRGTDRMPQFRALGKGRWQASDGGAWRAASESVLALLRMDRFRMDRWSRHDSVVALRGNRVVLVDSQGAECGYFAGLAPVRWLEAEATRAALHLACVGEWAPALSWEADAVEVALRECQWMQADEARQSWLAQAELWHQAEFAAWSAQDGDDVAEQEALETAMGSPMPEGGNWP